MITLDEFVNNLEQELEDIEPGTLTPNVNYRDIDTWSSMYALIIIAYVDLEFDVILSGDDLRKCNTIRDLYNLVKSKA